MAVKSKVVWTMVWTWIQEVKQAVTLYNSLYSVSFPSLCLYHLKHKPVWFPITDEEKKIKLIVTGGGRKNNPVLSFTLPALSPAFCWALSSSFFVQHPLLSYPSLWLLYCPSLPPIPLSCFPFPRKVLVEGSCLRERVSAHGACDRYRLK